MTRAALVGWSRFIDAVGCRSLLAALSVMLLAAATPVCALDLPRLTAHVNDYASLLPSEDAQKLEARLSSFEAKTKHQFALLIVPNMGGLPLEDYSIKVAEAWRLGDKQRDDGLLMVVAQQERKMRIEVGYGLEGDIPDAIAARVVRDILRPAFQRGDYAYGIAAAFDQLIRAAGGDGEAPPQPVVHTQHPGGGSGFGGLPFFLVIVVLFVIMNAVTGGFSRRRRGYYGPMGGFGGGGFGGGGFGGFGGGGGGGGGGFSGGGGGFGGGGASGDW